MRRVTTDKSWTARLDHLDEQMTGYVERGEVPGLVTLLSGPSEVRVKVLGNTAVDGEPMQRDTLFRVASFTKPIAAVAAMILVDEECLELDRPLDDLLPELAERRVLTRVDGPLDETVPAKRAITLRDLLTFRLGLGEPMAAPGSQPIQRAEADLELKTFGPPKPRTPLEPDEWMSRLGTLPLQHQPGKRWKYATGSHLIGVLVARAAGQPLEVFLRERLFEPLGMKDTGFTVPASELHRLATSYVTSETGELEVYDGVTDSQWCQAPTFPDAAGGLISTADDFASFARMLLDGGVVRVDQADDDRPAHAGAARGGGRLPRTRHRLGLRGLGRSRPLRLGRRARHVLVLTPRSRDCGDPADPACPLDAGSRIAGDLQLDLVSRT